MAEDPRRCVRCAYGWFAKRVQKPAKAYGAGAGWALLGSTGMAAGAGAKAGAHYATKLERHERWRQCPRCGSRKVRTEPRRGFVPTAAEEAASRLPEPSDRPPTTTTEPPPTTEHVDSPSLDNGPSPWPRRAKIAGIAYLCIVFGPVSLVYGSEAVRRTGRGVGELVSDPDERRPLLIATAGILGTLGLLVILVEQIALGLGAAPAAEGEFASYHIVGLALGGLVSGALIALTRRRCFSRLRLPAALRVP